MAALLPIHLYGLEVPAGDIAMSARPEVPAAFRITMAAIDPSAEPEGEEGAPARATLKIIRQPLDLDDYDSDEDDEDDFDADEMERILAENDDDEDEDDESDDADLNGGPSDPAKSKKARQAAAEAQIRQHLLAEHGVDVDVDGKVNGVNGTKKSPKAKGKMPLSDEDDDEMEDEESDEDDSEGEVEEFVICTLDPTKNYQQPLDITIGEDERVWFKVSGTHSIYLTGNYVEMPEGQSRLYDPEDDEDDEYDLEPDEDELDGEEDEEEDELDGMDDPRITELDDEMEEDVPKLVTKAAEKPKSTTVKGTNKRSAPESDDAEAGGETLDDMIMANSTAVAATNSEPKLSKKQLKKLKKNDGSAGAATVDKAAKPVVEDPSSTKSDKKVSFAKNLEQGPTPTKDAITKDATANAEKPEKAKATLGVRTVQGVTIDDKKLGTGAAAKKGDRVGMRYIGKLNDGKVFDSNKKGKPFSFKLGSGEVIKGWDIGVAGMAIGGERRITVPAHLAYGSKGTGPIPANSTLVFDVKMLEINKSK